MKSRAHILAAILIVFDLSLMAALSRSLVFGADELQLSFLNVGQGDSGLIRLPEGPKILIDGGPDGKILDELAEELGTSRYIDLLVSTHAETNHINGLVHVLRRYRVGAVLLTGRGKDIAAWGEFVRLVEGKHIPVIKVGAGDRVRVGESVFTVLSPNAGFRESAALNDTALVLLLESGGAKTLFTADIGENVERVLVDAYNLDADILKVGHHGSKFSSSNVFLREVTPRIAVIQVGQGNRYGHPTAEALSRLEATGAKVYRNDEDGRIKIKIKKGVASLKRHK